MGFYSTLVLWAEFRRLDHLPVSCVSRMVKGPILLTKHLSRLEYGGVALLAAVGFSLRFAHVGRASLWLDEAATAAIAGLDWTSFWIVLFSREMNMVAYYCVLRLIPPLQGSEVLLRLLSVIFGTGVILAVWLLAKEVLTEPGERLWAVAAAALVAVNGFLIAYSQEARGYAMALCLLVLSACTAVVVIRTGKLRATWCLLALAAIYSHFYTVLWIAPQAWAIWKTHRPEGRKFFARITVITAAGLLPLSVFMLRTRGGQLDWVPRLTPAYFFDVLAQLAGYSRVALLLLLAGSMAGSIRLWRRSDIVSRLIVMENALPVGVLLAGSALHPLFVARFLIFAVPFLVLTAVEGFAALGEIPGAALSAGAFVVMFVVGNQAPRKADWRSMTNYLCAQHGQAIAFWPSMQKFPYWYYSKSNPACPKPVFPEELRVTVSDFQPVKREFDTRLCAAKAESVLIVMDSESQPQSKTPGTPTPCYLPVSATFRDGLQLFLLRSKN